MLEWIFLVVAVCSLIQSVFGMGILVFGTPTLLLMGLGFTETLGYLLPASIAVSIMQVWEGDRPRPKISPDLWIFSIPMIVVGLGLSIVGADALPIKQIVGIFLIVSAIGILSNRTRAIVNAVVNRRSRPFHAVMGFVHGLSNMGGSLLSLYAASIAETKEQTRYVVAFYYLVFGVWQLLTLLAMGKMALSENLATAAISISIYLILGKRIFRTTSEPVYKPLFIVFMAVYGTTLLVA